MGHKVQFNVAIPKELKEKVEIYCVKEDTTMEDFVTALLKNFFTGQGEIVIER